MIERELYLEKIRPFIDKEIIKVLTGIRRSGKSVLLKLLELELKENGINQNNIMSFNLESFKNIEFKDANKLYKEIERRVSETTGRCYLFLDEIQEVQSWETSVNALRVDFDIDIYLTGSNAHLLSGELATYLAGRYLEIVVYPFSFNEFVVLQKNLKNFDSVKASFMSYIELGGMPFLGALDLDRDASTLYLEDLYRSVLLKDVIERNRIRDVELLERILQFVISNIGRTFSAKSISDYFKSENRKVASETVYNYIKAFENACLIHRVKRQDLVGKKILKVQEKIFIVDHGLKEAIVGGNQNNIDQVLENMIYIELLRRGFSVTIGKYKDREIDFIAEKNHKKLYIQVAYLLASDDVIEREFGVLESIKDNYPKLVLSLDEFSFARNGIEHQNIRDFLLDNDM